MAAHDEDPPWTRQLLVTLAVLLAVAVVIGGVLGVVALGAARVTGLGEAGASATSEPSLVMPTAGPTARPKRSHGPGRAGGTGGGTGGPGSAASPTAAPRTKRPAIALTVSPARVGPGQRIDLTGRYPGGDGARLQVQRREGGAWTDFPVDVPVTGGRFATYVTTGRTGPQQFRVTDPGTGRASNPARVRVG